MVAEYASTIGASTIVVGASTHGGLPALMDGSASRELGGTPAATCWSSTRTRRAGCPPRTYGESLAKD